MHTKSKLCLAVSGAAMFAATSFSSAIAQTAPAPAARPAATDDAPRSVDEIIVTAQKRSENLQNVPIVVTTVTRQLLQDTGVKDIKDLALLAPGLLVTSTTSEASTTARIRGIGTVGDNAGLESSVGVVIDGVYRPRNGVGFGDLGNVDRIEVLKGPQGTLFGKSATAGVINIITAAPKNKFGIDAELETGNYGDIGGSAEITGPIVNDKLAASLYFADRHRDGFFDVDTGQGPRTSTHDTNRDFYTIRGQLLFTPTDSFKARVIADYSRRHEECCIAVITRASEGNFANNLVAALGGNDGDPAHPYKRNAYANQPDGQRIRDAGISLQADWDIGPGTLTSISAYRDWRTIAGFDADFSTADIDYLPPDKSNSTRFRTFSQELRYAGTSGNLDWLIGGFYSHERLDQNNSIRLGKDFTPYLSLLFSEQLLGAPNAGFLPLLGINYQPGDGSLDRYRQLDQTYAIFTNETFHFTDKLSFNAGFRYSIDDKSLNQNSSNIGNGAGCAAANAFFGVFGPGNPAFNQANEVTCLPFMSPGYNNFFNHQAHTEHAPTGTAKLAYRFGPELMVYASYARGYKAGGFNLDRVQCAVGTDGCAVGSPAVITPIRDTRFHDETNNAFEVGEKATLLDRKLLLNAALFYQSYKNFQLNTFNGLVFVVDSIPKVISKGIDADFVWFASPKLTVQGGITVADTRYHLSADQLTALQVSTGFLGGRHSRLSLAPLYSASLAGTYTQPIGEDYQLRFNIGAKYSSRYNTGSDLDPGKSQKGYVLTNARLGFGPQNKRWAVEMWTENMFDTHYKQVAFNNGFQNVPTNATGVLDAFLGAPRTFGATLRLHY
ncbi:TonB-dependent receptor [Nostoc sp. 3335mG]|nr:TonB-dependent receptor [Nostoc sp. 3335mG]